MKYVVKCFYCEKTFTFDSSNGADFICDGCKGVNSMRDVVKRIDDSGDKKETDADIQAIKGFDMAMHPVVYDDNTYESRGESSLFQLLENGTPTQIIIGIIIFFVLIVLWFIGAIVLV